MIGSSYRMNDIINVLSYVLPLIALAFTITLLTVNIYMNIRKRFSVKVNCWFCNVWAKVPYDAQNCFDCPNCLQYNGFGEDGGYNKLIEAQRNPDLNNKVTIKYTNHKPSSNGLCNSCNHNQQLKITQLARFTPLQENNYDVEIEHFRKQLEKTYELCKPCNQLLRYTLMKEKAFIFGNHVYNIQKKGLSFLDLNKSTNGITVDTKLTFLINTFRNTLNTFASLIILNNIFVRVKYNEQHIQKYVPESFLPYVILCRDISILLSNITNDLISYNELDEYIPKSINLQYGNVAYLATMGLILQLVMFMFDDSLFSVKVNQFLCWSILTITSWTSLQGPFLMYIHLFQIFWAGLVIYCSFLRDVSVPVKVECRKYTEGKNSYSPDITTSSIYDDPYLFSEFTSKLGNSVIRASSSASAVNFDDSRNSSRSSWSNLSDKTVSYIADTQTIRPTANIFKTINKNDNYSSTASVFNNSLYTHINNSLDDLHLSSSAFRLNNMSPIPPASISPVRSEPTRRTTVLSPSKLKNVTQNSWVAGGFWRNSDGTLVPVDQLTRNSRTSSQSSSGFGSEVIERSPNPFFSLPTSPKGSLCGDDDRFSFLSEPTYHMSQPLTYPSNPSLPHESKKSQLYKIFGDFVPKNVQPGVYDNLFVQPLANPSEYAGSKVPDVCKKCQHNARDLDRSNINLNNSFRSLSSNNFYKL